MSKSQHDDFRLNVGNDPPLICPHNLHASSDQRPAAVDDLCVLIVANRTILRTEVAAEHADARTESMLARLDTVKLEDITICINVPCADVGVLCGRPIATTSSAMLFALSKVSQTGFHEPF